MKPEGTITVVLHGNRANGRLALISPEDADLVCRYRWHVFLTKQHAYPRTSINRGGVITNMFLHRMLLNPAAGMFVDHINGDSLDNRRCNLRVCTPEQNAQNRVGCRGVSSRFRAVGWHVRKQKWQALVHHAGTQYFLGYFTDEEDAARAVDKKSIELFGEFARLNCPA